MLIFTRAGITKLTNTVTFAAWSVVSEDAQMRQKWPPCSTGEAYSRTVSVVCKGARFTAEGERCVVSS